MPNIDPISVEQFILFLENSSLYKYWDKDTQERVKDVVKNTPEKELPKLMEDLTAQENKMKLAEGQEAKEKKIQLEREMRAQAKIREKNDQEEAQAYAEKLIDSLGSGKESTPAKKKKKLFGIF